MSAEIRIHLSEGYRAGEVAWCHDDPVSRTTSRTVVLALASSLVGVLAAAALVRETRMGSGAGQALLVPLVAVVLVAVALKARTEMLVRLLVLSTATTWLVASWVPELLLAHQGFLILAVVALAAPGSTAAILLGILPAAVVGSGRVVPPVTAAIFVGIALFTLGCRTRGRVAATAAALVAGTAAVAVTLLWLLSQRGDQGLHPEVRLLVYEGVLMGCTAILAWGMGVFGGSRLADLTLADDRAAGLEGLSLVLAETLGDSGLVVERVRFGVTPAAPPETTAAPSGQEVTWVHDGDDVVAQVRHRPGTLADPATRAAVMDAVRLVTSAEDRQHDLERRLVELTAARQRVDTAADRRRAENAAVLRRHVTQPLEETVTELHSAGRGLARPERDAILSAAAHIEGAVAEMERLVWDVPMRRLGGGQLSWALRELAARSPLPASLHFEGAVTAPFEVEAALYYVCAEALVNSHKHAGAERVKITLRAVADGISLEVSDDGAGGADRAGTGLTGLADRVSAVGGQLRVFSPPGAGTTLTATVPVTGGGSRG